MQDVSKTIPYDKRAVSSKKWMLKDLVTIFVLMLLALCLRTYNLSQPPETYFDEVYYVEAAEALWSGEKDPNSVHPPLGKWMIGGGMALSAALGIDGSPDSDKSPIGWRLASALAGILMVGATYGFAMTVFEYNRVAATAAAAFVATEHLHLTMSRIAMLDPFLALFCLLGAWWGFIYFLGGSERWALASGLVLGLATGCKWSGLFTAFGCVCAALFLDRFHYHDYRRSQRYFFWIVLLVPFGFFLTYLHLFLMDGFSLGTFETIYHQAEKMVRFRYDPEQFSHTYGSSFWQWPLVMRPIWFFYEQNGQIVQGVCGLGVWSTWWIFTVLLIERAYSGLIRRTDLVAGALVILWVCQWLPWAASTTGGFFFYMLPQVAIMGCLLGKWFADVGRFEDALKEHRWKAWILLSIYLVGFFAYLPFALGITVKRAYFDALFFLPNWI